MGVEHQASCKLTFESDIEKFQDQNENSLFILFNQFVNERRQNVFINDSFDTLGKLGQIDQTIISVISDLCYLVVE